jgi:3-keto-disaccharide hydrolase
MRVIAFTVFLSLGTADSCLAQDAEKWLDIFPGKDLLGWKRVPILPDKKLNEKNAWSIDEKDKVLVCDGVGVKEMLLYDKELGDGVFHVEWRFRKVEGDPDYNSGVYVRTAKDGVTWHQVQVAHTKKPPFMGDIFGILDRDKQETKVLALGEGPQLVKGPGQWNTYDITCQGKQITVVINGKTSCVWNDCRTPRGHIGMQAEFFYIEFKNLKFRELK